MNTLQELNTYSNSQIAFEDDRSLIITTATTTTTTQSVTVAEDAPVDLTTFGVTFSELRSLDNATADYITLEFDFSGAANPIITWPTKDAYIEGNTKYNNITFSSPSAGVFRAEHIQLNSDYLAVLTNTEIVARDQSAAYSYTITVSWPGNSYTQQFDVTTTPAAETNLNGLSLTARSLFAHLLFDPTLTPTPAATDAAIGSIYELVLTSTAGATLSLTQGGTPTVSVTIPGDKDTVNAALSAVYYTPLNGFYQQTDTINYSLTVTNPSLGSAYVSETGSFDNYVPAFGEVTGITNRSFSTSIMQDLFVSPYPVVEDTIGQSLVLEITTTIGEIKESSAAGSWGSTLTLTGNKAQLEALLTSVKYRPAIVLGTNTDTLSYTLTWTTFELDTGSWEVEATIDTVLTNLDSTGDTVTDIVSADLFPAGYNGGNLPSITSTDTSNLYELELNYSSSKSEINGISVGSERITGTASAVETALLAATYKPLSQNTVDTISYTFSLRDVTIQSGTFTKTLPTYFEIINVPSSITFEDQNDATLFSTPFPTVIDNTTGYNLISFNMQSPGIFNQYLSTVSYTGYVSPIGFAPDINAQIAVTSYDPFNSVSGGNQIISYDLVAAGVTWMPTQTISVAVPPEIEFHNFSNRSFVGNSVNNNVFTTNSPYIEDNIDPTRTLELRIVAGAGALIKGQGLTTPYSNTLIITGTAAEINTALSSTADPIGIIPAAGASIVTLTFIVSAVGINVGSGILTFDRTSTASYGPITHTSDFTITENDYYYTKMDALLVAGAGGGGEAYASGHPLEVGGGDGGDGAIVLFTDYNLSNLAKDQQHVLFEVGTGGASGLGGGTSSPPPTDGDNGTDSVLYTSNTPGIKQNMLYTAIGGGGGGAARSYYLATLGGSFANSGVATGGCGGGGGAAGHRDSYQNPPVVENEAPGGVAGVGYVSNGGAPTSVRVSSGNAGQVSDQPGYSPDWIANGGNGGIATLTSSITGTSVTYRAEGGDGRYGGYFATDGEDGTIIVRITDR